MTDKPRPMTRDELLENYFKKKTANFSKFARAHVDAVQKIKDIPAWIRRELKRKEGTK